MMKKPTITYETIDGKLVEVKTYPKMYANGYRPVSVIVRPSATSDKMKHP